MRSLKQFPRFGFKGGVYRATIALAVVAVLLSIATLSQLYSQSAPFGINAFASRGDATGDVDGIIDAAIGKLAEELNRMRELTANTEGEQSELRQERLRHAAFLTEIITLVGSIKAQLPHVTQEPRGPAAVAAAAAHPLSRGGDDLVEFFLVEEIRKYTRTKPNRLRRQNFMGANGTFTSIGHACFLMKEELEEYMEYDVGDFCRDDWKQAQRLMVHGCDPLPRRRCLARAPKLYTRPHPANESTWRLPDDRNVRWSHYRCKSFACLARNGTGKGFFKCADCFNLTHHELPRWMAPTPAAVADSNSTAEFLIEEVLRIKPGEMRIGLDFSVGTGTFAARMREFGVTVVSATINLGAPFSEMIALRGLVPLYLTINQRLPFFDNTLDVIHTTRFLDGWIDFVLLDFVLYDWDRVLRPGGLLWIDSFFCQEKDLDEYLELFGMLRYKKHMWVVVPKVDKDGEEVFFSAVLEKPARPF